MKKCPVCSGSLEGISLESLLTNDCPHCHSMFMTTKEYKRLKSLENINKVFREKSMEENKNENLAEPDYYEPDYEDRMPNNMPTYDEEDYLRHFVERKGR